MDRNDRHTLISNFFSLSVVQCANYLLPLATLPYLYRLLTPERYGLVAFAQAFMQYFIILTDYGFSLSATREISAQRTNKAEVARIFSSVMLIKLVLLAVSFVLLAVLVLTVGRFRNVWQVYFFAFGTVIGHVLFPLWFFQGIERMKYVALLNLLAKLVFTVLIFSLIRQKQDYVLVPLFNSIGTVTMGIIGLALALVQFKIRLVVPSLEDLRRQIKATHHIFVAKVATTFYTTSNVVILGLFTSDTIVGYYAAGEKIVRAIQGLEIPFSQATYPYVSKLACQSPRAALHFIRRTIVPVAIVTGLISIALFVSAPTIARLILGEASRESTRVIQIQAFLPFIIGLAILYGNLFLLGFGFDRMRARILIFSGGLSLIGAVLFVGVLRMTYIGLSVNVLLTESLILLLSFLAYRRETQRLLKTATEPQRALL